MSNEYIFDVVNETSKLDWAFPFQRTGAFPLDRSAIFSSITDAEAYALGSDEFGSKDSRKLGGTSYIGQIISVYDEISNSVNVYIIDTNRTLKPVGSSILTDDITIELIDNKIQLKDFGKKYFKYNAAQKGEEGNIIVEAFYEQVEGFKEGLEPKVILDNDSFIVGWCEPSPQDNEEILNFINTLIDDVADINTILNGETGVLTKIDIIQESLNQKADKENVYTKVEVNEVISQMTHLKRIKLNSKNELYNLDLSDPALELNIYMVPTGLQEDDDKYDEYMIIDGSIEKMGSWEVDLKDYAKTEDVNDKLSTKVDKKDGERLLLETEGIKLSTIEEGAEKNFINAVDSSFSVIAGKLNLNTLAKEKVDGLVDTLNELINDLSAAKIAIENKINKNGDDRLITTAEIDKLSNIKDLIQSVDLDKFTIDENGKLLLNSVEINEIEGLVEALGNKVDKVAGSRLITQEEANKLEALSVDEDGSVGISATVNASKVQELYNAIVNIVTGTGTSKYDGEFKNLLGIEPGAEKNFISSVNDINFTVSDGQLNLNSIAISKVQGLTNTLASKATVSDIQNLEDYLNSQLSSVNDRIDLVEDRLIWKQI